MEDTPQWLSVRWFPLRQNGILKNNSGKTKDRYRIFFFFLFFYFADLLRFASKKDLTYLPLFYVECRGVLLQFFNFPIFKHPTFSFFVRIL